MSRRVQTAANPGEERRASLRKQSSAELKLVTCSAHSSLQVQACDRRCEPDQTSRQRRLSSPFDPLSLRLGRAVILISIYSLSVILFFFFFFLLLLPVLLRPDVYAVGTHPPRFPPHSSSLGTLPTQGSSALPPRYDANTLVLARL